MFVPIAIITKNKKKTGDFVSRSLNYSFSLDPIYSSFIFSSCCCSYTILLTPFFLSSLLYLFLYFSFLFFLLIKQFSHRPTKLYSFPACFERGNNRLVAAGLLVQQKIISFVFFLDVVSIARQLHYNYIYIYSSLYSKRVLRSAVSDFF